MTKEWPVELELTLDGIAQGGEGVGRYEGRVVFVAGGLPGEQVRVQINDGAPSFARGVVTEVLTAAPERVTPRAPDADNASWQHIRYPAQLAFKRQILADQLAKIGNVTIDVPETIAATREWEYRSSARIHAEHGQLGYHRPGTRELRPLGEDPLLRPELRAALQDLQDVLRPDDPLESVTLRLSETFGYVSALLRGPANLRPLAERWRRAHGALAGVALPTAPAEGNPEVLEELAGITLSLRPGSFFQSTLAGATVLLRLIQEGLGDAASGRLLDLYSGVGTFALPLARRAQEIVAVEEFEDAVEDAEYSAEASGVRNVGFVLGTVERALWTLDGNFDAVVLDPPRRGCHPQALDGMLQLAPARIVYVACHPATLARDLKTLVGGGYRVESVQPVDLFPQTPHIEAVTVLVRE